MVESFERANEMPAEVSNIARVIVIAGGTQGLGRGIALHLAKLEKLIIVVCGRNEVKGKEVVSTLNVLGSKAYYVKSDLSRIEGCKAVSTYCNKKFKSLDALIYASGVTTRGTIETTTEEIWDSIFNTNLKGAFFLTQSLLPLIKKSKKASILMIGSYSSYCGKPDLIAYNASKSALVTISRNLANALKEDGIRVNVINLGWTDTDNERIMQLSLGKDKNWLDEISKKQPFGRMIKPQDVAYLAEFLLSKQAMMMTGSVIDFNQQVRI